MNSGMYECLEGESDMTQWKNVKSAAKVVGPIRCHTCQLMCRDSAHYLSHKCEPKINSMVRAARTGIVRL